MIFPLVLTIGCAPVSARENHVGQIDAYGPFARTNTNDGKSLMRKDGLLPAIAARPVRSSVANLLCARDETGSFRSGVVDTMGYNNSAHGAGECLREEE